VGDFTQATAAFWLLMERSRAKITARLLLIQSSTGVFEELVGMHRCTGLSHESVTWLTVRDSPGYNLAPLGYL
jgi:hypothetical protein